MVEICNVCGLPTELCVCEEIAREQQEINIYTVSRRYGKLVTIVEGIDSSDIDLEDLGKKLKAACASGGTVKEDRIELQGNHKRRVKKVLNEMGFNVEEK